MTSQLTKDGFEFSCDACGEVWSPPKLGRGSAPRDFHESWEEAKSAGWRTIQNKRGEWEHLCSNC
jgi:hypothetical protein